MRMKALTELQLNDLMDALFGPFDPRTNSQTWVTPNRVEFRDKLRDALASLSHPEPVAQEAVAIPSETEPVAWRYRADGETDAPWAYTHKAFKNDAYILEPLYTRPSPSPEQGEDDLVQRLRKEASFWSGQPSGSDIEALCREAATSLSTIRSSRDGYVKQATARAQIKTENDSPAMAALMAVRRWDISTGGDFIPPRLSKEICDALAKLRASAVREYVAEAWLVVGTGWKRVFIDKEAADIMSVNGDGGTVTPLYLHPSQSPEQGEDAALDRVCHDMFHALVQIRGMWKTISPKAAVTLDASIEGLANQWFEARSADRATLSALRARVAEMEARATEELQR